MKLVLIYFLICMPAFAEYTSFSATPIKCEGMAPEASTVNDCKTLKDRTFPVICEAPYQYTVPYNMTLQKWKEDNKITERIPEYRVYTLSIPGKALYYNQSFPGNQKYDPRIHTLKNGVVNDAQIVNLYVHPTNGRIVKFTTEYRKPAQQQNPEGIKIYDDPRLPTANADGKYEQRKSPYLKGDDFDEQGKNFELQLNHFLAAAKARDCEFAQEHGRALIYAVDPAQREIDHFYKMCDGNTDDLICENPAPAASTGPINQASTLALELGAHLNNKIINKDKVAKATKEFNLEMMAKLREGLLTSQAGIISATDPAFSDIQDFKMGPQKPNGKCDSEGDQEREERLTAAKDKFNQIIQAKNPEFIKARKDAEWVFNRQTVMDAIETQWAVCLNKHWAIAGGSPDAQEHYYKIVDRNRMMGLIGEGGRHDIYSKVKEKFKKTGLDDGFDWNILEDRMECSKPDSLWTMQQMTKRIGASGPDSPEYKTIMESPGITSVIRTQKKKALNELQEELDDTTEDCNKAATEFEPRYIRKNKGLNLFKNQSLVSSVVREMVSRGKTEELKHFNYVYCQNKSSQANHDKWKNRMLIGATAAAMILPFTPAVLPVAAGSVTLLATGLVAATAVSTTVMEVHDLVEKYDEIELAKKTFDAQIGSAKEMDEAQDDFYKAVIAFGAATALRGIDVYKFAKLGGQSLKAGRMLSSKDQEFYEIVTAAIKAKKIPPSQLKSLMNMCVEGKCDEGVEALAIMFGKNADNVAAAKNVNSADVLPDGFVKALKKDSALLSKRIKEFSKHDRSMVDISMPEKIKKIAQKIQDALDDPKGFHQWLIEMKTKMGENMLKRIAYLESRGMTEKADKLLIMLNKGKIDQGVYIQTLTDEAKRQGWGAIKKIPKVKNNTNADFFYDRMKDGDLVWDMAFRAKEHSRDAHVLQLLYGGKNLKPGEGRSFVAWAAQNPKTDVWRNGMDSFEVNLHSPEAINSLNRLVLPGQ